MSTIGLTHLERHERRREMAEAVKSGATMLDVAMQYGVALPTVRNACIEFFVIKAERRTGTRRKVSGNHKYIVASIWQSVCWDRTNAEIAAVLGVTGERVRQVRQQLGKPDPENKGTHRKTITILEAMKEYATDIQGLPPTGVVEFLKSKGVESRVHQVEFYARRLGIELEHASRFWTLIPWKELNWSLPNSALGEAWGVPNNRIAQYRSNNRKGSASITEDALEYAALVEVEKHKSEQWRAVTPKELWPETILV